MQVLQNDGEILFLSVYHNINCLINRPNIWAKIPGDLMLALQLKFLKNIWFPGKRLTVLLAVILTLLSVFGRFVYVFWPKCVLI